MAVKKKPAPTQRTKKTKPLPKAEHPRCGLCGKTKNLTKTDCCNNWICNDEHKYVLFTFADNSCHRNHNRYTICARHYNNGHTGDWKDCDKCREDCGLEMYVYFATNEYNFEKLANPPAFEPTKCADCGAVIRLPEGGYAYHQGGYFCGRCSARRFQRLR